MTLVSSASMNPAQFPSGRAGGSYSFTNLGFGVYTLLCLLAWTHIRTTRRALLFADEAEDLGPQPVPSELYSIPRRSVFIEHPVLLVKVFLDPHRQHDLENIADVIVLIHCAPVLDKGKTAPSIDRGCRRTLGLLCPEDTSVSLWTRIHGHSGRSQSVDGKYFLI